MKFFFSLSLFMVSSCVMLPNVVKAEQILLLNLQYRSDTTTTSEIQLYGNEIDPNYISSFSLTIDGKSVQVPEKLYIRLNWLRRSFSSDSLSGGIQPPVPPQVQCHLGGPSIGQILEARYLTYQKSRIVGHEMRPVFGRADNCLFTDFYKPFNSNAREDAQEVIEILNALNGIDAPVPPIEQK